MSEVSNDFICKECGYPFKVLYLCKYEESGRLTNLCYNCSKQELSLNPHKVLKVLKCGKKSNKLKLPNNIKTSDLDWLNNLNEEIKKLENNSKIKKR